MTPSSEMMPDRYISATTSMMAEPQMPVTPVAAAASSKPGSSDHLSTPMTRYFGSSVSGSMRTRSIAPGAARWPDGDFGALEGRAGRRGGGNDAVAVAEHDLGIGADIDQQHHLVLAMRAFRQRRAGGVRADMAGDAGQRVEPRARG